LYLVASGDDNYLRCYSTTNAAWPMFRGSNGLLGEGKSGPTTLSLRWKYTTDAQIVGSPTIVED